MPIVRSIIPLRRLPPGSLEMMSISCVFNLVSTIKGKAHEEPL